MTVSADPLVHSSGPSSLVAPSVSTLGDVITIPALWLAAQIVGHGDAASILGGLLVIGTIGATVWTWQTNLDLVREIFRESIPVLTAALVLSALAGLVLQKQQDILHVLPALGVLQPAFVSSAGALGGILCGRIATNLHIGSVEPTLVPVPKPAATSRSSSVSPYHCCCSTRSVRG